ncbi:uncharacterized protein FA14DRAFT_173276 [Meira miltonrushii]|uniref:Uncharacterized protein n=1 Tax=Meira miltonrushii TaxID=1280837 RepID=A0A316VBX4_9BASI|nr:uncharacterized protein FA14DRAFT_173276 [Meira miltonrushii]PWN33481.1 hypothetical protein FA14DRAFT_173276 [Meira miltonrushii]
MESPELDRRSADPSGSKKGPNPNRDYKQHFLRQKQRYDAASSDQIARNRELSRASLKQMKLQDEIEFLLDAIAGEKHRRKNIARRNDSSAAKSNSVDAAIETTEKEDVKPIIQAVDHTPKQTEAQQVDDELDDLMQEDTTETNSRRPDRRSGGRQSRISVTAPAPNPESASASGSVKRRRASYSDTDDELLESAGLSSTKRARND